MQVISDKEIMNTHPSKSTKCETKNTLAKSSQLKKYLGKNLDGKYESIAKYFEDVSHRYYL